MKLKSVDPRWTYVLHHLLPTPLLSKYHPPSKLFKYERHWVELGVGKKCGLGKVYDQCVCVFVRETDRQTGREKEKKKEREAT